VQVVCSVYYRPRDITLQTTDITRTQHVAYNTTVSTVCS